ncbi:hypothetical protein LSAT2_003307 [Lamellibrachia satsuma]|nr:hypothetical protein LSAT2_003307 [Lamellibrachia satsuma]
MVGTTYDVAGTFFQENSHLGRTRRHSKKIFKRRARLQIRQCLLTLVTPVTVTKACNVLVSSSSLVVYTSALVKSSGIGTDNSDVAREGYGSVTETCAHLCTAVED